MTTNWMMILVKKVFTFFSPKSSVCHARLRAGLFIQETAYGGLSYKGTKNVPWHILAPASVACGIYLIRRSVHPRGAFLLYRNTISCEVKKSPESHLWIQGIFSIPHSRHNVQRSKSVSKTPSGVFIVRIPRLKLSSETVI